VVRAPHLATSLDVASVPLVLCATAAGVWAAGFGYLAVLRHLAGGSHAEDLGFTDQVLWNFLRGQWFRMSLYNGATWNTELDVSHIARPDSLLAFHAEPMLLGFVPLYALGAGPVALLAIQAAAVAAGAVAAFRIGRHLTRSASCGLAVAAAYLLSPLGQWAVLADFHTSTLAAPLLLFSLERLLVARAPVQALIVAAVAASAREDVGPVLVCVGVAILVARGSRKVGFGYLAIGAAWTLLSLLVIRAYSGGVSPFEVRYSLGASALTRPLVLHYLGTLLLSGGWLALLAPLALLPALPALLLNTLSSSTWMASGQAHYSGLVLPFVTLATAVGLAKLARFHQLQRAAAGALVVGASAAYLTAGAGPLAGNYAPAALTEHAARAAALAAELPRGAAVSASADLVPRVSQRPRVYVFPAVLDADYVFVDLRADPAPTSAGDTYLRIQALLGSGDWQTESADDGLLLLRRSNEAIEAPAAATLPAAPVSAPDPTLVAASLLPSPDGALGVDGPHGVLRTTWTIGQPLPSGTRLEFWVNLRSGERMHIWDIAPLWWNPPDRWTIGRPVTVDVPDVPLREFVSWSATWSRE
jgi:uncharacterized membrane protein